MADLYGSGLSLGNMLVPVKAATIYAAQEQSLFLGGNLIPVVNTPGLTLRVPRLDDSVTAVTASGNFGGSNAEDVPNALPTDTKTDITCDLYAARTVVRDLGGIDPNEIGRMLGMAVAKKFDQDVLTALDSLDAKDATTDIGTVNMDDLFEVAAQIRGHGETGQLYGVISPTAALELSKSLTTGTANFAGGDFQTEALRNGFIGQAAGIQLFISAYAENSTKMGYVFSADAARIAMQKNVDIEIARRPEAVGFDVVASLHAGVAVTDSERGVKMVDAA